ncbi:MAG: FtsX-like permease family protein [Cumulibacter sp.]
MSVTSRAAFAELKHKPGRLAAVVLAIVIGSLFAVATTVFSSTAGRAIEVAVAGDLQNADIVVNGYPDGAAGIEEAQAKIAAADGVLGVDPIIASYVRLEGSSSITGINARGIITDPGLAYAELESGQWPAADNEVAIPQSVADDAGVKLGDTVSFEDPDGDVLSYTVTGISKESSVSALTGATIWLTQEAMNENLAWVDSFVVRAADPEATSQSLQQAMGSDWEVLTGAEARAEMVDQISDGTIAITVLLGSFAAIALVVAAIVIGNTFVILLAQRRRQIALQRLVGATSRQMRRQILIEAAAIGVGGTAIGAILGIFVGWVGAEMFGAAAGGLALDPVTIAIACAATIAATLLGAYVPIRSACRVAPIEALRPAESQVGGAKLPIWRICVAGVLLVGGLAIMALGASATQVAIATLGGLVSVCGLLFGAQLLVVPVGKLLRPLGRIGGTPGTIAARDVTRHAARATNTVVAIIVGVGLISMIQVAAEITRATALHSARDSDRREEIEAVVDIMTNVATGLLAVTAVIAIVGIANTLALSVIERKRESGLMRALGVQRGQLRSMISIEAFLLALIGGVIGVVLGLGYGAVAAYSVLGDRDITYSIPWGMLGGLLALAIVGGLLASVLPAIRAGKVTPVEALAAA